MLLSSLFLPPNALPYRKGHTRREKAAFTLYYMQVDTGGSSSPVPPPPGLEETPLADTASLTGSLDHGQRLRQTQQQLDSRLESHAGVFLDQCNPCETILHINSLFRCK